MNRLFATVLFSVSLVSRPAMAQEAPVSRPAERQSQNGGHGPGDQATACVALWAEYTAAVVECAALNLVACALASALAVKIYHECQIDWPGGGVVIAR